MTPGNDETTGIYDALLASGLVSDPALLKFGARCVIGRWLPLHEIASDGECILKSDAHAVEVVGQGPTWEVAWIMAASRLGLGPGLRSSGESDSRAGSTASSPVSASAGETPAAEP